MTFSDWIKKISPAAKTGETAYFRNHEGSYYDAIPPVWKNISIPVQREVICIIDRCFREAPPSKYPRTKENVLSLVRFLDLDKIPRIKIFHMLAKEHPEVIEVRQRLIAVDVLDSEEAAEGASIVHDNADFDEEDGSGLVGEGVTEEVQDIKKALKSSSLSSYTLKPSKLLTHVFENNMKTQEKLFKHMCNFGLWSEWRKGRSVISYYLDVETTKDQCRLLNPTTLDCITGYIMEGTVGERALKRLLHRRLRFIDGSISSYCSILNSPE